ncbi:MAG: TorF family putative porin [Luteolibacter sp.]
MQNYCKTIGALAAASALVAGNASAEIEYEIHTAYTSQYIFRGIDLGTDLVEAGFDIAGELDNGLGFSAGAWYGSVNDAPFTPGADVSYDELDVYGEVSYNVGPLTLATGYIFYHFPNNIVDDAQEAYFSIAGEFAGLETSLTYFHAVETDNDGYTELFIGKGFELSPCLTLSTGATTGYLIEEGDLVHVTAKVSLDWNFAGDAVVSPFVAHSWSLSEGGTVAGGAAGDSTALYGGAKNELFGGVSLAVSF